MGFLGKQKLKKLIQSEHAIGPDPDWERLKGGAYELSLGNEVFTTDSADRKKEIFDETEKGQVTINPGQFALLLTKESVKIPKNIIAFISIKAGIKLRGLVNISGFHVDPGFHGNLVFSVYNAGTSPISLETGEPYFLIWFADLSLEDGEDLEYNGEHKNQKSIPPKYIDALLAGELASPSVLSKKIDDNQKEIDKRLDLIEKDGTAKDYLIKTALGFAAILVFKFVFDILAYDNGFRKGLELKRLEIKSDSVLNELLLHKKHLMMEIDSMQKVKDTL